MYSYRYSGLCLSSNIRLPELEPSAGVPQISYTWNTEPGALGSGSYRTDPVWYQEWTLPSGRKHLSIGKVDGTYLFRFWDNADFFVVPGEVQVHGYPVSNVPAPTMRHLLLDQVLPSLLGRYNRKAIHASAVSSEHGVMAFLGASGYGKSSLAASLVRRGFTLVADDCLVLHREDQRIFASVAYPGVRLVPEAIQSLVPTPGPTLEVAHYSQKWRLPGEQAGPFAQAPQPLTHLFILGDPDNSGEDIQIVPITARDAFVALRGSTFSLDVHDPDETAAEFQLLSAAAVQCRAHRLQYPRRWDRVTELQDAILAAASEC